MLEEHRFENILKSLRVRKGKAWTQAKTAQELGVSRRLYVGWENGDSLPSPNDLKNIAAMFGLSYEDEDVLYRAAAQAAPRIHNLPFLQNPFFIGREKQLEQLGNLLNERGDIATSQPVSLSGLGGIGKTQLALEYAHRCHQKGIYRAVFWIDAAERATIEASYLSLAHLLNLPQKHEADTRLIVHAVKQWFEAHTCWLLILDNADDLGLARLFMPVAHKGHILLTTRSQIVGKLARQLEIQEMELEEGLRFLLRRAQALQDGNSLEAVAADTRKAASQLVTLLGALPLALEQAAAYIEETGVSFAEYTKLFREHRNYLMHRQGMLEGEHRESVVTTIKLSIKKAHERHPLVAHIIMLCAFLQPDDIPEELFQSDLTFGSDMIAFYEGMATLLRYSLVKRNLSEKTYSMHRLVQAVIVDMFPPEGQKRLKEWVMYDIWVALPRDMYNFKNWERYERLLPHALLSVTWEDVNAPSLHTMLWTMASYLNTRGRYAEAEPLLVRTLAVSEQYYGPDQPETAAALKNLADFYISRSGREEEGKSMLERALAIEEKNPGNDPLYMSNILASLAALHWRRGEYEEAERLHFRVLTEMEQHLGVDHPNIMKYLGALASDYVTKGKYDQALVLFRRVFDILNRQMASGEVDEEDPYILLSLGGVSEIWHLVGNDDEAGLWIIEAVHAKERIFGAAHPEVIQSKKMYIRFLHSTGRHAEAEALEAEIKAVEADGCPPG